MYSLILIIFFIPLYFSHILAPYGIIFPDVYIHFVNLFRDTDILFSSSSSFERQKVYLFLILLICSLIEYIFQISFSKKAYSIPSRRKIFFMLFLIGFPILGFFVSSYLSFPDWFLWSEEKKHGYLFFIGLIFFYFLVSERSKTEKDILIQVSIISAVIVSIFALLEYLGLFAFLSHPSTSWESWRTISTLWNPNYLAGYILIHFPLLSRMRLPERWIIWSILFLALLSTASFTAIWLLIAYCMFLVLLPYIRKYNIKNTYLFVIPFILLVVFLQFIPENKLLSFKSRTVLMKDMGSYIVQHPWEFFFGHGPESVRFHFSVSRNDQINSYFPRDMIIDSSHDIFLDFIFQYGYVMSWVLFFLVFRYWWDMKTSGRVVFLLWSFFFGLNIVVLVHCIVLLLVISEDNQKKILL